MRLTRPGAKKRRTGAPRPKRSTKRAACAARLSSISSPGAAGRCIRGRLSGPAWTHHPGRRATRRLWCPAMHAAARLLVLAPLALASGCANLDFKAKDANSGTFRSTALSFTFLGADYPQSAILVARANASDSQLPNLVVTEEHVFPYLWKLDFLLDVICLRWASVTGT